MNFLVTNTTHRTGELHVMVDLETLSTKPNAVILTFAAMKFNPCNDARKETKERIFKSKHSFYRRIDLESCAVLGQAIDDHTIDWWAEQDDIIREEAFAEDDRHSIETVLTDFHKWCFGAKAFWSNGSIFDIMIIEDYNRKLSRGNPWKFWEIRDCRTIYALADPEMPEASKHHALMDCWRQVVGIQNCYRKLTK